MAELRLDGAQIHAAIGHFTRGKNPEFDLDEAMRELRDTCAQRPDLLRVFVACRCGTDMSFAWPAERDAVRCFACGARFGRPAHLPAAVPSPPWTPAPRRRLTRGLLAVLALHSLARGRRRRRGGLRDGEADRAGREHGTGQGGSVEGTAERHGSRSSTVTTAGGQAVAPTYGRPAGFLRPANRSRNRHPRR